MLFEDILKDLRKGKKVARKSWSRNITMPFIVLDEKNEYFLMYEGNLLFAKQCSLHAYEILADDWYVLD